MIAFLTGFLIVGGVLVLGYLLISLLWSILEAILVAIVEILFG